MVIWIIGLSGSGKTTLSKSLYADCKKVFSNTVLLDGDVIRNIFDNDLGYSLEDRKKNSKRIQRICRMLDEEGINVICSILSIFPEHRNENRQIFKDYYEVFIDVPLKELEKRDSKGLYKSYRSGELVGVVGRDIEFVRPENPDLIIQNSGSISKFLKHKNLILDKILKLS